MKRKQRSKLRNKRRRRRKRADKLLATIELAARETDKAFADP